MSSPNSCAIVLLILGLATVPAWADQKCLAASIDQVGKCPGKPAQVQRAIDRELHGIDPHAPRAPFDTRLLATQIAGDFAIGEIATLAGGSRNDSMFLIHGAGVDHEGRVVASGRREAERLAWIRYLPAAAKSGMRDKSGDRRPVIEVKAIALVSELLPPQDASGNAAPANSAFPDCVIPKGKMDEDDGPGGNYVDLTGKFRWLRLSSRHRVLVAEVSHSESYAGGGGTFTGEVLLDVRSGALVPIACYAVSRYQMFGGGWNPDGTRQHPESYAAWRLAVVRGDEWPNLLLRSTSPSTPGTMLVWDEIHGRYVEARHQRRR